MLAIEVNADAAGRAVDCHEEVYPLVLGDDSGTGERDGHEGEVLGAHFIVRGEVDAELFHGVGGQRHPGVRGEEHARVGERVNPVHKVVVGDGALCPACAHVLAAAAFVPCGGELVLAVGKGDSADAVLRAVAALVVDHHFGRGIEGAVLVDVYPEDGAVVRTCTKGDCTGGDRGIATHHEQAVPDRADRVRTCLAAGLAVDVGAVEVDVGVTGNDGGKDGELGSGKEARAAVDRVELCVTEAAVEELFVESAGDGNDVRLELGPHGDGVAGFVDSGKGADVGDVDGAAHEVGGGVNVRLGSERHIDVLPVGEVLPGVDELAEKVDRSEVVDAREAAGPGIAGVAVFPQVLVVLVGPGGNELGSGGERGHFDPDFGTPVEIPLFHFIFQLLSYCAAAGGGVEETQVTPELGEEAVVAKVGEVGAELYKNREVLERGRASVAGEGEGEGMGVLGEVRDLHRDVGGRGSPSAGRGDGDGRRPGTQGRAGNDTGVVNAQACGKAYGTKAVRLAFDGDDVVDGFTDEGAPDIVDQAGDADFAIKFRRAVEVGEGKVVGTGFLGLCGRPEPAFAAGKGMDFPLVDGAVELLAVEPFMDTDVEPLVQGDGLGGGNVGSVEQHTVFEEGELAVIRIIGSGQVYPSVEVGFLEYGVGGVFVSRTAAIDFVTQGAIGVETGTGGACGPVAGVEEGFFAKGETGDLEPTRNGVVQGVRAGGEFYAVVVIDEVACRTDKAFGLDSLVLDPRTVGDVGRLVFCVVGGIHVGDHGVFGPNGAVSGSVGKVFGRQVAPAHGEGGATGKLEFTEAHPGEGLPFRVVGGEGVGQFHAIRVKETDVRTRKGGDLGVFEPAIAIPEAYQDREVFQGDAGGGLDCGLGERLVIDPQVVHPTGKMEVGRAVTTEAEMLEDIVSGCSHLGDKSGIVVEVGVRTVADNGDVRPGRSGLAKGNGADKVPGVLPVAA